MIDIKRGRAVDQIAQEWWKRIDRFFNGRRVAYVKLPGGQRKRCRSYAQRLIYQCSQAIQAYNPNPRLRNACYAQLRFWWINLDKIILAPPQLMDDKIRKWEKRNFGTIRFLREMTSILIWYYDNLPKEDKYYLIDQLNLKTCPYCNRLFIHTFKGIRAERPELDHFHPKASYPIFCLSFYNLIPACHSCNHVKLEDALKVNPYSRAFQSKFILTDKDGHELLKSAILRLTRKEIHIALKGKTAEETENDRVLGLTEVYNKHTDYVKELIDKSMAYDAHARKALVDSFQGAGHHPRQVYDFVWGHHLQDAQYPDRPLSKLTKDMLDLLEIKRK